MCFSSVFLLFHLYRLIILTNINVYFLQTWILEVLPENKWWWAKPRPIVVPRGLSWHSVIKFQREDWPFFFGVYDPDVSCNTLC